MRSNEALGYVRAASAMLKAAAPDSSPTTTPVPVLDVLDLLLDDDLTDREFLTRLLDGLLPTRV